MTHHPNDRRSTWSTEVIVLIVLTIIGWASSAGMTWQHVADIDSRLARVERKLDVVANTEMDHGKTR
jgi:hypothetical protein